MNPEKQNLFKNPSRELNAEQKKAAEAPISPLLIVAGAGTGKTRTLTERIVHLIAGGMSPERICAITFTNKAAGEMAHRTGTMLSSMDFRKGNAPYIGTFHSLGAKILRRECRAFGREPNFAIFDDHDSRDILRKAIKIYGSLPKTSSTTKLKKDKKEAPAFFMKKISDLKNLPEEAISSGMRTDRDEEVKRVFAAYEAALQRNNAFDFDDLIEKPVALFKAHPDILRAYQNKFDAILVDEYQDINPKQYEFVRLLASGHRNLTVVGDDEQTIYTWRYADIKIFLDFDKDWPGATVHFLEENYRSTGNIIGAAGAMVQNNRFRTPKQLWTKQAAGELITLYEAWGENDEAAWIARKIVELQTASQKDGVATIAILYRTNAQSRAIEQALIRENIPYKIFGGLKFYERREVKDAVAALRFVANQRDEVSRERLEKNLSKRRFVEFRAAVAATGQQAESPKPDEILKLFLTTFNYMKYLEENFINADERAENIAELANFASGFDTLSELLERLSLLQATDDENAAGGGSTNPAKMNANRIPIHLSTIHMAKGLEFDAVFVAGAAEGLLPHIRSIDNDASLEEERRLMYVAMTRARKNLYVSFYGLPSRFVGEIPEEYVTLAGDAMTVREGVDDENSDYENYISL